MTRQDIPAWLLTDIENYLNITWSDPATDEKVRGMIGSGMAYLNTKLGAVADYTVDGMPLTLLKEYCRYMRDSALDVFESNYLPLILTAQLEVTPDGMESTVSPEN